MRKAQLLATSAVHAPQTDAGVAEAEADETEADDTVATVSAAHREAEATSEAAKADEDVALSEDLEALAEAKETMSMSAYFIYQHLLRVYGAEEMNGWPYPGSEGGNNPDIFTRPSKRKGSAGTSNVSWCDTFAEAFKIVKDWRAIVAQAPDDAKTGKIGAQTAAGIVSKYEARISAVKTKIKNAIALHHQLERAKAYDAIELEWSMERVPLWKLDVDGNPVLDANGKRVPQIDPKTKRQAFRHDVIMSDKPLVITDKASKDFWFVSISTLLGYDFDMAEANGGTVEALFKSARSGAEEENGNGGVNVKDIDTAIDMIAGLVNYLDNATTYGKIAARLGVVNDETDIELQTLDKLVEQLNGLIARHRKRLDALEDAESVSRAVKEHAA